MTTHEPKHESRAMRRAVRRLEGRIHSGKHTESRACGCKVWDASRGYNRPGAMKAHA